LTKTAKMIKTEKKRLCLRVSIKVPFFLHFRKLTVKQNTITTISRMYIQIISGKSLLRFPHIDFVEFSKITKCSIRFHPIAIRERKKVEMRIKRLLKTDFIIFILNQNK